MISDRQREYREVFLKSKAWLDFRKSQFAINNRCHRCRKKANHLHHIRYPRNIWHLDPEDVVPLCKKCHEIVHDAIDKSLIVRPSAAKKTQRSHTLNLIKNLPEDAPPKAKKRKRKKSSKRTARSFPIPTELVVAINEAPPDIRKKIVRRSGRQDLDSAMITQHRLEFIKRTLSGV